MMVQHAQYSLVVSRIVEAMWRQYRFAEEAVGTSDTAALPGLRWYSRVDEGAFDHRTVQEAHDLMAADFRRKAQAESGVFRDAIEDDEWRSQWIEHTKREIEAWAADPFIVRAIVLSTQYANKPEGLAAERTLARYLRTRYAFSDDAAGGAM